MDTNKIKSFAKFARSEADKAKLDTQIAKQGYINLIINGYCSANGIQIHLDDSIMPQSIQSRFLSDMLCGESFDVQNLSWLYQYYITTDRKNTVDAISGAEIKSSEICASTQVFTPDWIVKYLADNSLGRFLNNTRKLEFYIDDGKTEACKNVCDITLLDPCCGCGNILTYTFDIFMMLYGEAGFSQKQAASMIIKNNIYGADIDIYAAQIAQFCLLAQAYKYDNSIFDSGIKPNIFVIDKSDGTGSLKGLPCKRQKFTVVCTNPPYLTRMSKTLKAFLNKNMKPYSKDLFTAFMYKGLNYAEKGGYMAYMTPNVWMYLSSHKSIREYITDTKHICSLISLEKGSYFAEASVDICAFVIKNDLENDGIYINLKSDKKGIEGQREALQNTIFRINNGIFDSNVYHKDQNDFKMHPERLILYSVPQNVLSLFNQTKVGDIYTVKQGMTTGNNKRFLRYWWQVPFDDIGFGFESSIEAARSEKKWFPYNKGGKYRKWYGNNNYVVMYQNDGEEIKKYTSSLPQGTWVRLKSREYYFKPSVTWSFISSTRFGVRYSPCGSIFDVAGSSLFADEYEYILGFLGSNVAFYFLQLVNPTMNYQIRDIKSLPYIEDKNQKHKIVRLVKECIKISKNDWDNFETSYGFTGNPLIKNHSGQNLKYAVSAYIKNCEAERKKLAQFETKINELFAKLYGLENILDCTVEANDVTLTPQSEKSIVEDLLSYCVGVALGRFTQGGICDTDKTITINELCDFTKSFLNKSFNDIDYIHDVIQMTIEEYFECQFIGQHTRKYKNKPIYYIENKCIGSVPK